MKIVFEAMIKNWLIIFYWPFSISKVHQSNLPLLNKGQFMYICILNCYYFIDFLEIKE